MNEGHRPPRIVGLHGLTRSGKDTLADMLVSEHGFFKVAFADEIYRELSEAFSVSEASLRSEEWKTSPQPELQLKNCQDQDFVKRAHSLGLFQDEATSSRVLLQLWGTEYRRHFMGRDYWTKKVIEKAAEHRTCDLVISDVREDHEAIVGYWLCAHRGYSNFQIAHILRPGTKPTNHSSDSGISSFLVDHTITNDGSVLELLDSATAALNL